ncbi:MAG: hypothetical protein MN733_25470, partial [Nitrososphaera sp.]|nr:hypothetical protein [Nitrososphaera sp.]
MKAIQENHLVFGLFVGGFVAVASVLWLHQDSGYEPLIAALVSIGGIVAASVALVGHVKRTSSDAKLNASALTPDSPILKRLMEGAVETVCRGVSVPQTPESAALSAFIFKLENGELVCTHYWAPNPRKEQVGLLRFSVSEEVAKRVAVVRAAITKAPCRTPVAPIPENSPGISGDIDAINFVLATPILNPDKSVWGVVDLDTANEVGKALLRTEVSDTVMHNLAAHL